MAKLSLATGTTSYIAQIFIQDSSSTTGAGLAGLTNASASLTAYFHRDTDTTATAISLVTMTVGTFTSSGFKEIDATNMPGWYQFCPPNTALASGAKNVAIHLKGAANMAPLPLEIELTAVNNQSATAFITGVNSIAPPTNWNLDSIDASGRRDISKILGTAISTPATAGVLDVNVKNMNNVAATSITAINANQGTTQPVNFTGIGASALAKSDMVDIAGAAVSATTAQIGANMVQVNSQAASAAAGVTFPASIASPTNITAGTITTVSGNVNGSVNSVATAVSLSAGDSPVLQSGTAAAGGASTITIASTIGADNRPNGCIIKITSGTGVGQARGIIGYVDATKVVTVDRAWTTNPDATSVYSILYVSVAKLDASSQVTVGGYASGQAPLQPTTAGRTLDVSAGGGAGLDWANIKSPTTVVNLSGTTTLTVTNVIALLPTALVGGRMDSSVGGYQSGQTPLQPTVAGRTLDVSAVGGAGLDWANVKAPTTTVNLSGTSISSVASDVGITQAAADKAWNTAARTLTSTAPQRVAKNTALANFMFLMIDSADHVTGKTALTITATRSIDGAAFGACANSATEVGSGIYKINLAASDLNGDVISFKFASAGADSRLFTVVTQP